MYKTKRSTRTWRVLYARPLDTEMCLRRRDADQNFSFGEGVADPDLHILSFYYIFQYSKSPATSRSQWLIWAEVYIV